MIYAYRCIECKKAFDVVKSVKDIDCNENCPKCGEFAEREFCPQKIHLSGTRVTHPEFNPGLGAVVKNKQHKDRLMKERNVVEVGNDYGSGDRMQNNFDTARERKKEKEWEAL